MRRLFLFLFGASTFVAQSQVPDYVPTEGLVGWWPLDGNAVDAFQNMNGVVFGATEGIGPNASPCLSFDGVDDYVEVPTNPVLESIEDALTISCWFLKLNPTNSKLVVKRNFVGNPNGERHHFELAQATEISHERVFHFSSYDGSDLANHNCQVWTEDFAFDYGVWTHVSVTFENGLVKFFVDGFQIHEHDCGFQQLSPNNHWLNFARMHRSGGVPFSDELEGGMQNVGLWNRALTELEIFALYNAAPPNPGCTDPSACNFNAEATSNDGSCIPSGCMEPLACNFNPLAECEGEACDYTCCPGPGCCAEGTSWDFGLAQCIPEDLADNSCPQDLNFDGVIGVGDLMDLLSFFGSECLNVYSPGGDTGNDPESANFTCGDPLNYHGYNYSTVQIGDQCWFAENLRTVMYRNGESIPGNLTNMEWSTTTAGAMAWPQDDEAAALVYGSFYNGHAIFDQRGLCPIGWNVSDWDAFLELADYAGGQEVGCAPLKSTNGWTTSPIDLNGTDAFGFSGLPSGYRQPNGLYVNEHSSYWTTSLQGNSVWNWGLGSQEYIYVGYGSINAGSSVRCLKDE